MIIPRFNLNQSNNTVSITIRAPYCNLSELDVSVEDNIFIFFCTPYYLRLHLPGKLEDNDNSKSSFDSDTGEFNFTYEKLNAGEHFPDLEFITKFLCSKVDVKDGEHKIEIIGEQHNIQDIPKENSIEYGFAMRGGYNFNSVSAEFLEIFQIDPHIVTLNDRRQKRLETETSDFNSDHYIADLIDNEEICELMHLVTPWSKLSKDSTEFTSSELDFLKDLPNISYNLSAQQITYCQNGLLEILYAYCYDKRTTCFESTCESGWTISKLCSTFTWFDGFLNPKEALISAFRRSLIYPLYRNFKLSQQIYMDLQALLQLGEQFLIKCLIDVYNIFLSGDSGRYILNNLFVKDYIIYIMKWDKEAWLEIVKKVNNIEINKSELGLNLTTIENLELGHNTLADNLANLKINEETDTDSDDTETNSSETESDDE